MNLVRVDVDPEKRTEGSQSIGKHHAYIFTQIFTPKGNLEAGQKKENPEVTHTDVGIT